MTESQNRITLYIEGDCWMAEFEGPQAGRIERAMGTTTLPTPFRGSTSWWKVRDEIARLNPGASIIVDGGIPTA